MIASVAGRSVQGKRSRRFLILAQGSPNLPAGTLGLVAKVARAIRTDTREDEVRSRVLSLPRRFRGDAADGLAAEWELKVGEDTFTIAVMEGGCFTREGPSLAPAAHLSADPETWLAIDDGSLWGIEAFLARRLSVRGNLDLGARLQTLFRPHGRERSPFDLEQRDVQVNGLRVSTYVVGEGPTVVILHGLGASKISVLPMLPPLVHAGYRLVVPDLPGHGESDKPRGDYSPRFYARVLRQLLDALGVDRTAVVGNSLGGRVALEMAVRSPDRVTGLALLDPAVPGFRVRYVLGFTRVIPTEVGAIPFPLREKWMKTAVRRLMADPSRLPAEGFDAAAGEFIRVYRNPAARMAFFDSLRHILIEPPRPFWAWMGRIHVPALVIWGEEDRLVPVRLAYKLAEALPLAELVVLPRVGHVPQFEAPEETSGTILRFLAGLPS
jgi:pimeloyl-ACP methyl ester carboxylesterase/putative sterol carrier protein